MRGILILLLCLTVATLVVGNEYILGKREDGDKLVIRRVIARAPEPGKNITVKVGAYTREDISYVEVRDLGKSESTVRPLVGGLGSRMVILLITGDLGKGLLIRFEVRSLKRNTTEPTTIEPSTVAPNTTTEGSGSSEPTEGPSNGTSTVGSTSNPSTKGQSVSITTEGPTTSSPTEKPTSSSPTEGPITNSPTEGPSNNTSTEGSTKALPTEGPSNSTSTEGSTRGLPTEGSTRTTPTEGSTKTTPTEGPTGSSEPTKEPNNTTITELHTSTPSERQNSTATSGPTDNTTKSIFE